MAEMRVKYTALDVTSMADTAMQNAKGLGDHQLTVELYMSYAATETYATLAALVGTNTTVYCAPASGAQSATNPKFTLTNTYLEELPVLQATVGEISKITITFKGGNYNAATS